MEIFQGSRVPAGEHIESTMRCVKCGTYITHAQEDYVVRFIDCDEQECWECGQPLYNDIVVADIHPASEHLLDVTNAKDAVWYHATNRANWMEDLFAYERLHGSRTGFPLVHVGTLDAATSILSDKYVGSDDWIYLYSVKLSPTVTLDPELYEDENMWPRRTRDINVASNAFRYVNRYEATGSISILMDPRELIVESVERLTPEQAQDMVRECQNIRVH